MKHNMLRWIFFSLLIAVIVWLILNQPRKYQMTLYLAVAAGSLVIAAVGPRFYPVIQRSADRLKPVILDIPVLGRTIRVAQVASHNYAALLKTALVESLLLYRIKQTVLLLTALTLMYIGQIQVFREPLDMPTSTSFVLILVGLGLLLYTLRMTFAIDDAQLETPDKVLPPRIRWHWLALSVGLFCFVAWRSTLRPPEAYWGELLLCWGLAIYALVTAVSPQSGEERPVNKHPLRLWEYGLLAGLLVAALLIRGISLDKVPPGLDTDEADFTQEAVTLVQAHFLFSPFEPGVLTQPRLFQGLIAASVGVFGPNLWGARIPSVILGALTVPLLYLLGRELRNWRTGLVAALFLLAWAIHVQFSRLALNMSGDTLLGAIAFYFLLRGIRMGSARDYALAGAAVGAAQLFWIGARILPLVIAAYLFYLWLRQRRPIAGHWRYWIIMVLAAFLVSLPQNVVMLHFQSRFSDIAGVNIFVGGHLQKVIDSGNSVPQYLLGQVRNSFLALIMVNDQRWWFGRGSNLMGPFGGPLLIIGAAMSIYLLWKYPKLSLPFGWGLAVIVGGSTLSIDPPSYERYMPGVLALALLVEMGLSTVAQGFSTIWQRPALTTRLLVGLATLVCVANLAFYMVDYVPSGNALARYLNYRDNLVADQMIAARDAGQQIILVGGWNTTVWDSRIIQYFMMNTHYLVVTDEMAPYLPLVDPDKPFSFIVAAQRKDDLDTIRDKFPGGKVREVYYPRDNGLAVYVYQNP